MTMGIDSTPSPPAAGHDDTRAVTSSPDGASRTEQPAAQQGSPGDARSQQRPESLTRVEYADAVRENGPPIQGARDVHVTGPRTEPGEDEHADRTGTDPPARGPAADGTRESSSGARSGSDVASEESGDGTASAVTRFHAEFRGHPIDLYTDGTRWAAGDQARSGDTVAGKAEIPDHPPTGEELVESADEDAPRAERFRRELYRESDDIVDNVEKNVNDLHDIFSHPPTSSYETTPADGPHISAAQHSGIDAGAIATTVFVLGVAIDRGVRGLVQHYKEHARGE
jgi:hypothetical protein